MVLSEVIFYLLQDGSTSLHLQLLENGAQEPESCVGEVGAHTNLLIDHGLEIQCADAGFQIVLHVTSSPLSSPLFDELSVPCFLQSSTASLPEAMWRRFARLVAQMLVDVYGFGDLNSCRYCL